MNLKTSIKAKRVGEYFEPDYTELVIETSVEEMKAIIEFLEMGGGFSIKLNQQQKITFVDKNKYNGMGANEDGK